MLSELPLTGGPTEAVAAIVHVVRLAIQKSKSRGRVHDGASEELFEVTKQCSRLAAYQVGLVSKGGLRALHLCGVAETS